MVLSCFGKTDTIITIPGKDVMINIIERICILEEKIKKGEHLTRLEEAEKKELSIVVKAMKYVQSKSLSRLGDLAHISPSN